MTDQELSLKDYVEGRFERMANDIDRRLKAQQDSIVALLVATELRFSQRITDVLSLVDANDLRYQQRFEAQGKELDKAFSAAKGAVDAALSAADKAALKAEISADKRFEDLGGLIREQFKSVLEKIEAISARTSLLENARSTSSGTFTGLSMSWIIGLGAFGAITTLVSLGLALYASLKP